MKKTTLLFLALAAFATLKAQWVDDPVNNTFIANASADGGEIYLSTDEVSGDTYLQWCQMRSNGWVPTLQRLNFEGVPQWGNDGITITGQQLATWSQGVAMAATNDGGVVTCFSNEAGQCIAVRINADGTFPWGEQGIVLFDGQGGSRTELLAGDDGGVWALGADYDNTYLCYIHPDGTTNQTITISDSNGKDCVFGLMVPGLYNSVFVVYEKESWAYTYYYEKELYVVGYTQEGVQIGPEVQLMSSQTIGGSYIHYAVPDGIGGGYAYIWHPAIGGAFNTYVFHFDHNGHSTISDLNGIPVHSTDPSNFYLSAYGTVDPKTHDLVIAYEQTDATTQSESRIYMNRITTTGEKVWGEGILTYDNGTTPLGGITIDAFEDGSGFAMVFYKGVDYGGSNATIEALGFDMDGNSIWSTQLNSVGNGKNSADNSTGFHLGQNIIAWISSQNGGVYGQNIGVNGEMGEITPIPSLCPGPENFEGEYVYDMDEQLFGVNLTWTPFEPFELYYLYRTDVNSGEETTIEIEGTATSYFDETGIGAYKYQLKGASEACGLSLPATTPDGEDHFIIEVTGLEENASEEIVSIARIYTMSGQCIKCNNISDLSNGVYILQGLTQDGRLVSRKVVVNR